ncbi:MAG: hypothetical protein K6D97_05350 [Clostridia bacterium]|nr:hypothetical protein [Clostridia bacterium]
MLKQRTWDKYEAAFLIHMHQKCEVGEISRDSAIKEVSRVLRERAKNNGELIDERFRNLNGITMRFGELDLIFGKKTGLKNTSKLFVELAELYKSNKAAFYEILEEKNNMELGNEREIVGFVNWFKKKYPKGNEEKVLKDLLIIEKYLQKRDFISSCLFEISDYETVKKIHRYVNENKGFKANNRIFYDSLLKAITYYMFYMGSQKTFVDSNSDCMEEEIVTYVSSDNLEENTSGNNSNTAEEEIVSCSNLDNFQNWLMNKGKAVPSTAKLYATSVGGLEKFASANGLKNTRLYGVSASVAKETVKELENDSNFWGYDAMRHGRCSVAIKHLLAFLEEIEKSQKDLDSRELSISIQEKETGKNFEKLEKVEEDSLFIDEEEKEKDEKSIKYDVCSANNIILEVLNQHYKFGFNTKSPIEMMRLRNFYMDVSQKECVLSDDEIISFILNQGFLYGDKVYLISRETKKGIDDKVADCILNDVFLVYYEDFYECNYDLLHDGKVISPEMIKDYLRKKYKDFIYKEHYFSVKNERINEKKGIINEINRVWGDSVLNTVDNLKEKLPYIPIDKIKYGLANCSDFVWNSFETYTRKDKFIISESDIESIKFNAVQLCSEKGSAAFEDLDLDRIFANNYELTDSAIYELLYPFLKDEFERNKKTLFKKGNKIDTFEAIKKYCNEKKTCKYDELQKVMYDAAGEIRYPTVIEAANSVMIRVSYDDFVADTSVFFDTEKIDSLLEEEIDDFIGLKEITSFGKFPDCGFPWNGFLLESFCRRFSNKYRYECITPNSKNAGAIINHQCQLDYYNLMIKAIVRANVDINRESVYDYLVSAGYLIKKQLSNIDELINDAKKMKERNE